MRKIKLFSTILITVSTMFFGLTAYAAEKDYTFSVTKEYNAGKISIELPNDEQEYTITAKGPENGEYKANKLDDGNMEIVINEPMKKGEWTVHVERTDATDDNGEVIDEPVSVKLKFEGSMEMIKDVSKEITVASDIVGLSMYFKDDSFVAEWTDTTVGNVDIEVTDEKTSESLGKETVQDRYYELPLDNKVESIIVKIVPSVSAREEGAEKYFTFKFDNHPAATVTYEDLKITNKDEIGVHIKIDDNKYKVMMMDNGEEKSVTDFLNPGEYDFTIPTEVGDNNFLVYIIDELGNMRSTAGYVEKDVVAPILQLERDYVNINTQDEYIEIGGKVEDYYKFTINDADAKVEGDHTFKYRYDLKEGLNTIHIVAEDEAGNISEYTATVTRIIPVEEPIPWLKIVIIVAAIGLAGLYVYDVIRKKDDVSTGKGQAADNKKKRNSSGNTERNGILYDLIGIIVPCVLILITFKCVLGLSVVSSGSMEPTLKTGNTVVINRLYKNINRGDIVIFISREHSGEHFGKRIIGLPGDKIEFRDGYVVVNGQYLDETAYIDPDVETNCSETFEVPENCYFVMGDNREDSDDSRFWNNPYVVREDIEGVYMGQIDFSIEYDVIKRFAGK